MGDVFLWEENMWAWKMSSCWKKHMDMEDFFLLENTVAKTYTLAAAAAVAAVTIDGTYFLKEHV